MEVLKYFMKPFEAPQANQLTGLYMRATLVFDGLNPTGCMTKLEAPINARL